ncbi:RluA family pseudouridine synthase [Aliivibrio fischeri]|uniref:Ribosomal large subunit pseudouridine synthase A n=1 Tax=Aliivibrio fischeri (strain ATCC 700601 / ES114) TaxID=312309 RepID=Q5E091_ALIF1|nr:RluA family pseudouridine synthase [Aliivibrio fischeri]AAW87555.1 ribosomal large subunit pseudouridine synthase A [Aliivibrio fischeri ES114]KLU78280.1 pseudouridine synthase [Aliivibrio fischeri]MCE7555993.1 pseudouridine synthase [Aliivibrio fischeri]MCE7562867.1 pseudouridine synthase [Aliivibrio fischeri]MCE7570928.1 pseudouridine synthase [Aliivibrio fischeri]
MPISNPCFTSFTQPIDGYTLPEKFTFPFCYEPHPLCELAAEELQRHLEAQQEWHHNFGLSGDKSNAIGKMFGVLLVKAPTGEIGYLSAFSGKIADSNHLPYFVPPVFDMLEEDGFFKTELAEITEINATIKQLEANPQLSHLATSIQSETTASLQQIEIQRQVMIEGRKSRKAQRAAAEITAQDGTEKSAEELEQLKVVLGKESVKEKNTLRDIKLIWDEKINALQCQLNELEDALNELKTKRKNLSNGLQKKLFQQYKFLNTHGIEKDLNDIFKDTPNQIPPAGSGECAAPKLLQYAFAHGFTPLALAEFWWGIAPKSEIRQHKKFYASCQSKCQPILGHMLDGIEMDENPLLINPAEGKDLEIVYEDEFMVVVNKPADFLSVPGKNIHDSVYARIQQRYPDATGGLIIHRLDMATSGLLVLGLTPKAHKRLQQQFINRTVEKRYTALLDGVLEQDEGLITLPMRGDLYDRPRQLVCFEHGKPAETTYQVIERKENKTKVYLYPKTGRTHQLRVHCAHYLGLNMPITGDGLYGKKANRLHLHAGYLSLIHPITKEPMEFNVEAEF